MGNTKTLFGLVGGLLGAIAGIAGILSFDWAASGPVQSIHIAIATVKIDLFIIALCATALIFDYTKKPLFRFVLFVRSQGAATLVIGLALFFTVGYLVVRVNQVNEALGLEGLCDLAKDGEFYAAANRADYLRAQNGFARVSPELRQFSLRMKSHAILTDELEQLIGTANDQNESKAHRELGRIINPSNPSFELGQDTENAPISQIQCTWR